jgi:ribosomal protein S6--L-glutamate ligase
MTLYIASDKTSTYFTQRLVEESRESGLEARVFDPYTTDIPSDADYAIWRVTGVRYDDTDLDRITRHSVVNPAFTLRLCRDKWMLYLGLERYLPLAPTIPVTGYMDEIEESLQQFGVLDNGEYVLKTIRGNQGRGVHLISNKEQLKAQVDKIYTSKDERYILQPRLKGKEYRIFLQQGFEAIVLERTNDDAFVANFHQNGIAKLSDKNFAWLVKKVEKTLNFSYLALDVIDTKDGLYIVDINTVCGIEQLEKLSGINIARRILSNILKSQNSISQ